MDTQAELSWTAPDGYFTHEPIFVQNPGTFGEDDGILLVSGFSALTRKGMNLFINIVTCQQGGVSDEPPWLQAAMRHGPSTL